MISYKFPRFAARAQVSTTNDRGGTLRQWALVAAVPCAALLFAKHAPAATIVACIGEQTTSTKEAGGLAVLWPAKLQGLLGGAYVVTDDVVVNNVGSNGNTVTKGDCVTAASLAGPPNIVVIGPFAEHDYAASITEPVWQASYQAVVNKYLALTPKPVVYVMTPPPATFLYQSKPDPPPNGAPSPIPEQLFAANVVKPAVLAVAAATPNVKVIDLFSDALLGNMTGQADGHFTAAQHTEVAQLAYNAIKGNANGAGGAGGTSSGGAGGASGGGAGGASSGGAGGGAGGATFAGTGGTVSAGGLSGSAGSTASGGAPGSAGSSNASAGSTSTAGATSAGGNASTPAGSDSPGCTCSLTHSPPISRAGWVAVLAGALLLRRRRRG